MWAFYNKDVGDGIDKTVVGTVPNVWLRAPFIWVNDPKFT